MYIVYTSYYFATLYKNFKRETTFIYLNPIKRGNVVLLYFFVFIIGRSLTRLSENSLLRLGVVHPEHRQEILRKISKLRLRSNILLLRDMERRQQNEEQQNY